MECKMKDEMEREMKNEIECEVKNKMEREVKNETECEVSPLSDFLSDI